MASCPKPRGRAQGFKQGTWLEPEEFAYNTPTGSASRSNRRACAIDDAGRARVFRAGVPDTFFTIPAIGKVGGRRVAGYLMMDTDNEVLRFRGRR